MQGNLGMCFYDEWNYFKTLFIVDVVSTIIYLPLYLLMIIIFQLNRTVFETFLYIYFALVNVTIHQAAFHFRNLIVGIVYRLHKLNLRNSDIVMNNGCKYEIFKSNEIIVELLDIKDRISLELGLHISIICAYDFVLMVVGLYFIIYVVVYEFGEINWQFAYYMVCFIMPIVGKQLFLVRASESFTNQVINKNYYYVERM